jgi:PAS domain S-box-containing protein
MPRRRANILIVDDQQENLLALEAVLEPLGQNLVRASSGEEALRRLLDDEFACILLDVQMPDMNGFETAEYIKQREKTRNIPIIFLTAIDKEAQQVFRGYTVGAVDYIFKPFDPEVLRSKVSVFVDLYEKNARVQESEERFRTAFDNAPIGMALISPEGIVVQANSALSEISGYRRREIVGRTWLEVTRGDAETLELFNDMLAGKTQGFEGERRYVRKDGSPVDVMLSISLARDGEGRPLNFITQVADVTERKRAEADRAERIREQAALAEARAIAETIQKLQKVTDAALEHLALNDLLAELIAHISEMLDVDTATILLMQPDEAALTVGATTGLGNTAAEDVAIPIADDFTSRIATTGKPQVAHDMSAEKSLDPLLEGSGIHSVMGVPLLVEGRVSGVIHVGSLEPRTFTTEDENMLQLVADRAALAIEHSRLYERELSIVETLQRSLLPERLPTLPGLDMSARYLPGGPGADVGGDWYDAMLLEGGRIAIAMGDVVGHGLGAAALMGQLRNALRAYALDGHSPSAVVERLDRLVEELEPGRMATLLFIVLEPDLTSLRFASAGHLPPLVLGPDGKANYLEEVRDVPLGVAAGAEYGEATAELEPGSILVAYTDGLVEERGTAIDRGLDTLKKAVLSGPRDPSPLCDHILAKMLERRAPTDDIAVLALHTIPLSAERLHLRLPTEPKALVSLRRTLARWLDEAGASAEESHDLQVACHEACSNAIEHAYRFGDNEFEVDAALSDSEVTITITDRGSWRPPVETDRGRGLHLIKALTDSMELIPGENGTTVRLRRTLASLNGAGAAPRGGKAPQAAGVRSSSESS